MKRIYGNINEKNLIALHLILAFNVYFAYYGIKSRAAADFLF